MQVFVDPTELGQHSQLPQAVQKVAKPLAQLEERTGADLLLSIVGLPAASDTLLARHCESGMLIQLKRWNDLQSAINTEQRLFYEVKRMRDWCSLAWLVVSGVLFDVNGKAVVGKLKDKRLFTAQMAKATVSGRQGLAFNAVDGALDAFRLYGGYVKFIADNDNLLSWLERMAGLLEAIQAGEVKELQPRSILRELREPGPVAWLAGLFDGIGHKTAEAIFQRLLEIHGQPATLYQAISYVTSYCAEEIPGITLRRIDDWRALLGLHRYASDSITPALYETMGIEHRLVETGELYWRGSSGWGHYRNDGPLHTEQVYTPQSLRTLLGVEQTVTWKKGGKTQKTTGRLQAVQIEPKFEYLLVENLDTGYTAEIRLDSIINVEDRNE